MKNKLLYLLTIIITLFTFNMNVNAAQELTCVYEKKSSGKIVLVQDKSGNLTIYQNSNDVDFSSNGWQSKYYKLLYRDFRNSTDISSSSDVVDKELFQITSCPKYSFITEEGNENQIIFGDDGKLIGGPLTRAELEKGDSEVKIPSSFTVEGMTTDVSCDVLKSMDNIMIEQFDENKYRISCVYAKYLNNKSDNTNYDGCHIIQLNITKTGTMFVRQSHPNDPSSIKSIGYSISLADKHSLDFSKMKQSNDGWCPNNIYVNSKDDIKLTNIINTVTISSEENEGYESYPLKKIEGYNLNRDEKYVEENISTNPFIDCVSLFAGEEGKKLKKILNLAINIIKILIPIILIGLGIMDFAKAIFSGSEDNMKKVQAKFIKRVIIAVCIFLIPSIITFILEIFNLVWDKNISTDFCGIL